MIKSIPISWLFILFLDSTQTALVVKVSVVTEIRITNFAGYFAQESPFLKPKPKANYRDDQACNRYWIHAVGTASSVKQFLCLEFVALGRFEGFNREGAKFASGNEPGDSSFLCHLFAP
jgi:hypothetical protein